MMAARAAPLAVRRLSATLGLSSRPRAAADLAKLVDLSRCTGCKACEVACKEWNGLAVETGATVAGYQSHRDRSPDTWLLVRFREVEAGERLLWLFRQDACLHCGEPGCLFVCPAPGAVVQYENGVVDFDHGRCIGCCYCIGACPFGIPRFAPGTGKVYKCNLCLDRVAGGLEPACVKTCPTGAIAWGPKEEMRALAGRSVQSLQARGYASAALYDPAGVGGTHMMFVLPHGDRVADYGLPTYPVAEPRVVSALRVAKHLGALLFGLGVLAAALHYLGVGPSRGEESGR